MLNVVANVESLLQRVEALMGAGELGEAEGVARQVLGQWGEEPRALAMLGMMALQQGRAEEAVDFFQRVLVKMPEDAAAHCDLATAYAGMERGVEAVTHYRLALALRPELSMARRNLHAVLAAQGHAAPEEVKGDGEFVRALNALAAGRVAGGTGGKNLMLAIRLYNLSLDVEGKQPEVLARLGDVYLQTGQAVSAIDVYQGAIEQGDRRVETFHGLAGALRKRARYEEALEAARRAGELDPADAGVQWTIAQILGEIHTRDVSIAKLRAELARQPGSEELKYQLAALTSDVDIKTLPAAKVAAMFDEYAQGFEAHIVERLQYRGHEQLYEAVMAVAPGRRFDILDLGCGTGLCGVRFKGVAATLRGVDLSAAMLEKARARGIYEELEVMELVAALSREAGRYDLLLAADVFEYVGDLEATFAAAERALRPGGLLAFSVERTDEAGFVFSRQTYSFAHSLGYLREVGKRRGLEEVYVKEVPLRVEGRRALMAWVVVVGKGY